MLPFGVLFEKRHKNKVSEKGRCTHEVGRYALVLSTPRWYKPHDNVYNKRQGSSSASQFVETNCVRSVMCLEGYSTIVLSRSCWLAINLRHELVNRLTSAPKIGAPVPHIGRCARELNYY